MNVSGGSELSSGTHMTTTRWFGPPESRVLISAGRRQLPGTLDQEVAMPFWAWVLIIVLLVLLLTGGVYVRR